MSEEQKLLPCPFCGGRAETHYPTPNTVEVRCMLCTARVSQKFIRKSREWLKPKTEKLWNTRPQSQLTNFCPVCEDRARNSGWISAEERQPPKNQRVLIFDPSIPKFPRTDTHTVIGYYRGNNHWCGEWYIPDGLGKTIYWMPLAEPPKEEE